MSAPTDVLIALGGNLGDVPAAFEHARLMLASDLICMRTSRLYCTAAHFDKPGAVPPDTPAKPYTNAVMAAQTYWQPHDLLARLLEVEKSLGRIRPAPECAPRTIDLDLLLWGNAVISSPNLTLPHPRMHLRNFVLVPACEVAPNMIHPVFGSTLQMLCAQCPDTLDIAPIP